MFDLFGADLPLPVKFLLAFIVVLALIVAATWLVRRFGGARLGTAAARGRQPRLAVIDAAAVDARRRLVLIRRDNVEHLVLIGGPTDIVVEQNIVRAVPVAAPREAAPGRPSAEGMPREAMRAAEPRHIEPGWAPQPEPAARARPAEPRATEPVWTPPEPPARPARPPEPPAWVPQPEPAARHSRPPEPKPPTVDLPPRPLPEPVTAALRAASPPEPPRAPVRPAAPRAPVPPPPPPAPAPTPAALEPEQPVEVRQSPPTADVNLADMAQRLEAALRRPARPTEARAPAPRSEPRPPREPARPTPPAPAVTAPVPPPSEPRPAPELPRAAAFAEPPAPAAEPPKPEAPAEPKPAPKSVFDSLEEEMANLLGKPTGKS
jgi:hypothetical protein